MGDKGPLELKVCRACLATDVKLFDLHKIGQADNFADLTRTAVDLSDGLPQYVCCYCRAQLLRCTKFRTKCQEAHLYLQEIQIQRHMITTDYVQSLDRTKYSTPLSHTKVEIIDCHFYDGIIQRDGDLTYDLKPKILNNLIENLKSPIDEINELINFEDFDDDDEDRKLCELPISFDEMNNTNNESYITMNANVKTEIIEEETDSSDPLIEFKKNKKDNVKSKKRRVNKREPKEQQEKRRTQKSNRYNEKFADEYVEFSELYNVRVICLSKEEQIRRIEERKESKEYKESRFSCDVCYKGFMSERAHKRHIKAHDPSSGTFVCPICHIRSHTQHALNRHARTHKKIFECTLCDMVNVSSHRAQLHFRWHKGDRFECKICRKQFKAHQTYLNHAREVHKPVSCPQCGEALSGTNQLNKHMGQHHRQNECSTCAVQFQSSEALVCHRKDNECNGKTVLRPCVLCGQNLSCRSDLSQHMKLEHGGETYTCNECQSVFTSDRALGIHFINCHHSLKCKRSSRPVAERVYLCECCAKSFPSAQRLKQHHLLHTDERPYKCTLCPKVLKTKSGLEFHINSHTGLRPYKCSICMETFKSQAHRHNHRIMKHTTRERRHKCTSCEKSFVTSSDLKKHVQYVHLKQPRPHTLKGKRIKQSSL